MNTTHRFGALTQTRGGMDLGTPDGLTARLLRPTFLHDPNPPAPPAPPAPPEPPAPPAYVPPASQADLDRIVQDRLARDRAGRPSDEQLAEWKSKSEALDGLAAASQSAEQQANSRADKAESDAATALAAAKQLTKRAAILAAASQVKDGKPVSVDPNTVADLLANSDAVTIDDAGQVTGAETAVQTLLTEKPFLAGGDAGAGSGGNGSGSSNFGGGHGRGGAGDGKPTAQTGRERYEARHAKKSTTSS